MLLRDGHVLSERGYARDLLQDIVRTRASLVVLGPDIPDLGVGVTVSRIRSSGATRQVSVLVLLPAVATPRLEEDIRASGANAVLRRPLDTMVLESWIGKLLAVARRVEARVPVQAQVVGSPRAGGGGHFCGVTRNLSAGGMLLASPVPLESGTDLDLEFVIPGIATRMRGLGRVIRASSEVGWPYLGYGVEFLVLGPECVEGLARLVDGHLAEPAPAANAAVDSSHGIHSTLRREEWIYEIRTPVRHETVWHAEIRRALARSWRAGSAGPFFVVEGSSPDLAVRAARDFVTRQG